MERSPSRRRLLAAVGGASALATAGAVPALATADGPAGVDPGRRGADRRTAQSAGSDDDRPSTTAIERVWNRAREHGKFRAVAAVPDDGGLLVRDGEDGYALVRIDADGSVRWRERFSVSYAKVMAATHDPEGGFFLVARRGTSIAMLLAFDADGAERWRRQYESEDGDISVYDVHADASTVYLAGRHERDAFALATERDGTERWRTITGGNDSDRHTAILPTAGDGITIVGASISGASSFGATVTQFDADGDVTGWERIDGEGPYAPSDAVRTADGGILIADRDNGRGEVVWIVKLNADLEREFDSAIPTPEHALWGIDFLTPCPGGYLVVGSHAPPNAEGLSPLFIAVDFDGELRSRTGFEGRALDAFETATTLHDGTVALGGYTHTHSDIDDYVQWTVGVRTDGTWPHPDPAAATTTPPGATDESTTASAVDDAGTNDPDGTSEAADDAPTPDRTPVLAAAGVLAVGLASRVRNALR